MRRLFFSLFLLMSISGQAQDNDSKDITIRIACGFAGLTSPDIVSVQRLTTSKSYVLLRQKLFSDDKIAVVLSTITLQELQSKGLVSLTDEEQQRISAIANW